jgi:hypothetical protein
MLCVFSSDQTTSGQSKSLVVFAKTHTVKSQCTHPSCSHTLCICCLRSYTQAAKRGIDELQKATAATGGAAAAVSAVRLLPATATAAAKVTAVEGTNETAGSTC